jgi:hypothetical protein
VRGEVEESRVVGERLANLGAWELYRFSPEDSEEVVCTVALLPASGAEGEIAYAVFRGADAEPSASGAIAVAAGWSDADRARVLGEILVAYRPKLPALYAGVVFDFGDPGEGSWRGPASGR